MIRYPELIVNGHTHSGKTASILAAAMAHKEKTGHETIFVNDEDNLLQIAQRVLIAKGIDVSDENLDKEKAEAALRAGPHLTTPRALPRLLEKLNPTGEAGTNIAIFLDAPLMCAVEMNTFGAGNNGKRFRMGVNINDPLGETVKNYSIHAVSIQNYIMPQ
jgi:hypothetical protein